MLGAAALARACRALDPVIDDVAPAHEHALLTRPLDGLATVPGVRPLRVFDDSSHRVGVVALTVDHRPADRVAAHLSAEHGIGVREGKSCAHPLVDRLTGGAVAPASGSAPPPTRSTAFSTPCAGSPSGARGGTTPSSTAAGAPPPTPGDPDPSGEDA